MFYFVQVCVHSAMQCNAVHWKQLMQVFVFIVNRVLGDPSLFAVVYSSHSYCMRLDQSS